MTIAAPILLVLGGVLIGLSLPAFSRHHILGFLALAAAATLLTIGALGNTVTVPRPHLVTHSRPTATQSTATPNPSRSNTVAPSPSK